MQNTTIYPPEWSFSARSSASEIQIGDLFPASLAEDPRGDARCKNCNGRTLMYAREITASGPLTWIGDKMFHSKIRAAACPVCQGHKLADWLMENCGLMEKELDGKSCLDIKIKNVKPNRGQEAAYAAASRLLSELPDPKSWALFTGDNGRGKTHLLCGLVNECRLASVWALYSKSATILEAIRESYDDPGGMVTARIRRKYENVPVLIVDEVDRVRWSDWAAEQLFEILDTRYMAKKATWFASNLGPSALEGMSTTTKALVSRISSGDIVALTGSDFRPVAQTSLPEHFIN